MEVKLLKGKVALILVMTLMLILGVLIGYGVNEISNKNDQMAVFTPLLSDTSRIGVRYSTEPHLLADPEFIDALIGNFEFSKVYYEIINGAVYVKSSFLEDKELVWNYTKKASSGRVPKVEIIKHRSDEEQRKFLEEWGKQFSKPKDKL